MKFMQILYPTFAFFAVILAVYTGLNGMLLKAALWALSAVFWTVGIEMMKRGTRSK